MRGIVLTDTNNLETLVDHVVGNNLGLVKIVTGWGIRVPWNIAALRVLHRVPTVIVRTMQGDGLNLDPNLATDELRLFYQYCPDCWIEIGNEPNREDATDDDIWIYRYNTIATIKRIRHEMPRAKIISPAMITDASLDRWFSVMGDLAPLVDFIGIHAYEWHTFNPPGTDQLARAIATARKYTRPFDSKPLLITELGINDTKTAYGTKVRRYRAMMNTLPGDVAGAVCYHICDDPIDADQRAYRIPVDALMYLR